MTTKNKELKRHNNLFEEIVSIENLVLADNKARKGKLSKKSVQEHLKEEHTNIIKLHFDLISKRYKTSEYTTFKIYEGKERTIYSLPYYPDRIVHHAILNVIEPIFTSMFISQTYSCIKGKGIHGGIKAVKSALKDVENTKYCLKLDITKFYPSINHEILKSLLRKKIKDKDLLWLLDEIIDSSEGIPIGNYTSQYFANFYLTYFDHWLKETMKVKYYFRYADDIVILSDSKEHLHFLLGEIKKYLNEKLKLTVKDNYQIFPVSARGIDFLGYVLFHDYIKLRKTIKKNFCRMMIKNRNSRSFASYYGWLTHCNSKNFLKKLW